MSILKDFIESLETVFTRRARVKAMKLPFARSYRSVMYWNPETKTVEEFETERADARHSLLSIQSVIDYVKNRTADATTNIFVGEQRITVEAVEHSPKDIATMALNHTPLFQKLQFLEKTPRTSQTEAIRLLRTFFAPFDGGGKTLAAVRSIKVNSNVDSESIQTSDMARVGKVAMSSAAGAEKLPEFIEIVTNVYLGSSALPSTIRVWLSIDFQSPGYLLFEPDVDQLTKAMTHEREAIADSLTHELKDYSTNVYEGEYNVAVAG